MSALVPLPDLDVGVLGTVVPAVDGRDKLAAGNPVTHADLRSDVPKDPDLAIAGLDLRRPAEDLALRVAARVSFDNPAGGGSSHDRAGRGKPVKARSEEHTSELQSQSNLVCRLLLEKKKKPSS